MAQLAKALYVGISFSECQCKAMAQGDHASLRSAMRAALASWPHCILGATTFDVKPASMWALRRHRRESHGALNTREGRRCDGDHEVGLGRATVLLFFKN